MTIKLSEKGEHFDQLGHFIENFSEFTGNGEFSAGGHYGIELSSMNTPLTIERSLKLALQYHLQIDRMIECRGIMRLTKQDIIDMVKMCFESSIGLYLSVGVRAIYDTGAFVHTSNGKRLGYRIRGLDNIRYAVDEIMYAIQLGVRGFLIYDEGLLYLLNKMRNASIIDSAIQFKFSVHSGCANPFFAKLIQKNGANSINVVPDLTLDMMLDIRRYVSCPLDIFSDTASSAGSIIRTYEIPDIVERTCPVYLKCGSSSQAEQNHLPSQHELEERIRQSICVYEQISRHLPYAKRVNINEPTLAIPCEIKKLKSENLSITV